MTHRRVHARGMAEGAFTWHRPTLRSDDASYARALDRAHNLTSLLATRSESLPITSRAGNDRNASPGELDFMHSGITRRMKAHVSTMLTEGALSIAPLVCPFKESVRRNEGCKPTSPPCAGLFGLTMRGREDPAPPVPDTISTRASVTLPSNRFDAARPWRGRAYLVKGNPQPHVSS